MKKLFTMIVSVALLATMVVGGTLANEILSPLNFSDESSTYRDNMITQNIKDDSDNPIPNNGDVWNVVAYPAIYDENAITVTENKTVLDFAKVTGNIIDYHVTVKNDSDTPVFVRTIFAFENTNGLADKLYFDRNEDLTQVEWQDVVGEAEINGKKYKLMVCTYTTPVDRNHTSVESLKQFCFDKDIKDFGLDSYQIMVKSQAIAKSEETEQFDFNTAVALFGEITADNHPWKETATNTNK